MDAEWVLVIALSIGVVALAGLVALYGSQSNRRLVRGAGNRELASRSPKLALAVVANVAIAAGVIALYPLNRSLESWAVTVALLTSILAASAGVGALLGFIFGVPSTAARDNVPDDERTYGAANNNLVQISDWLTKILIGAGLVQLAAIPTALRSLAEYIAGTTTRLDNADGLIVALIVYGVTAGFMITYLWTVLWFRRYFEDVEAESTGRAQQRRQVEDELDEEALRVGPEPSPSTQDRAEAVERARELAEGPESAEELRSQARRFLRLGLYDEAITAYELAYSRDPSDPAPLNFAGVVAGKHLSQYQRAETYYQRALAVDPTYASAIYNQACNEARIARAGQTSPDRAFRLLADAIGLDPTYRIMAQRDSAPGGPFDQMKQDPRWKGLLG